MALAKTNMAIECAVWECGDSEKKKLNTIECAAIKNITSNIPA